MYENNCCLFFRLRNEWPSPLLFNLSHRHLFSVCVEGKTTTKFKQHWYLTMNIQGRPSWPISCRVGSDRNQGEGLSVLEALVIRNSTWWKITAIMKRHIQNIFSITLHRYPMKFHESIQTRQNMTSLCRNQIMLYQPSCIK